MCSSDLIAVAQRSKPPAAAIANAVVKDPKKKRVLAIIAKIAAVIFGLATAAVLWPVYLIAGLTALIVLLVKRHKKTNTLHKGPGSPLCPSCKNVVGPGFRFCEKCGVLINSGRAGK